MPYIDDGSDDQESMFDKMNRYNQEAAAARTPEHQAMIDDAVNTSSGVLGSIKFPSIRQMGSTLMGGPERAIVDESIPMAQRTQNAAASSSVNAIPTAEQAAESQLAQSSKDAPKNFFDKAKAKATELGIKATDDEYRAMVNQRANRDAAIKMRNEGQTERFMALKKAMGQ